MNIVERATILHYHRHRIATHGDGTVGALGWKTTESQILRFEALAAGMELDGRAVLDVGCGYGDLRGFLGARFRGFSYIGLEQVAEFVAEARVRYGSLPRTWFHECDAAAVSFPAVDYVAASGMLSYRCEDPAFHRDLIRRMYEAAGVALVFNVLDARRFPDHPLLEGRDVEDLARFCRSLSPHVETTAGYLDEDVTFRIRREPARDS